MICQILPFQFQAHRKKSGSPKVPRDPHLQHPKFLNGGRASWGEDSWSELLKNSYPLVNCQNSELERSTMLFMGKSTISTGPFSIAICMFTRGYPFVMFEIIGRENSQEPNKMRSSCSKNPWVSGEDFPN